MTTQMLLRMVTGIDKQPEREGFSLSFFNR